MVRLAWFITAILCLSIHFSADAQDLPVTITADNANKLRPQHIIGSPLIGKFAYSPDGRYLLAATTEHTSAYRVSQLSEAPTHYPFVDFDFNAEGELVADGQRWNLDTGLAIGAAVQTRIIQPQTESEHTRVEVTDMGGKQHLIDLGGLYPEVRSVVVNSDQTRVAIGMREYIEDYETLINVHLYGLDGRLYGVFLQHEIPSVPKLWFSKPTETTPEFLVVETKTANTTDQNINLYDSLTGRFYAEYSGVGYTGLALSSDKRFFAYDLGGSELVMSYDHQFARIQTGFGFRGNEYGLQFVAGNTWAAFNDWDDQISLYRWDAESTTDSKTTLIGEGIGGGDGKLFADGRWLFFYDGVEAYFWDIDSDNLSPRSLSPSPQVYNPDIRLSTDGTRLSYIGATGQRILYDLIADRVILESAQNPVISPTGASMMYWTAYGTLNIVDIETQIETTLDIVTDYIGSIVEVDLAHEQFVLGSQPPKLITLSDDNPLADAVVFPTDSTFYDGQFVDDGTRFIGFSGSPIMFTRYVLDERITAEETTPFHGEGQPFFLSPTGKYVASYAPDEWCYTVYGHTITQVYLVDTLNQSEEDSVYTLPFACTKKSIDVSDEALWYAADGNSIRVINPDKEDGFSERVILNYPTDTDLRDASIPNARGVELSSNRRLMAVFIESYAWGYHDRHNYVEIFYTESLYPDLQRASIQPALTIPDTRAVTFSPDGLWVAADVGLYHLRDGLVNPEIQGSISAFNPDSSLLATYQNEQVTLWDVEQSIPLSQYDIRDVTKLGFSPDGQRLYIVRAGDVQVWGVASTD